MRRLMAVRLDIRPRLVLRDEPVAKARKRWRLPPLTVPAVAYWLGMAALTYAFSQLGKSPLESALAAEPMPAAPPAELAPEPAPEPRGIPDSGPGPTEGSDLAPQPLRAELPEPEPALAH